MERLKSYFKSFIEKISNLPEGTSKENYRYYVLTNYIYILAFFAHGVLLASFALVGVSSLAIFNIGSCLLFLTAILVNIRGYFAFSVALGTFEIIAHAIVCVYVLGLASGFQYYIVGLVVLVFSSPLKKFVVKINLAVLIALTYIVLNYYAQISAPIKVLPPIILAFFNIMNLLLFIFVISLSIFASDKAALKAEIKLAKALEELKNANSETEKKNQELAGKNQELAGKNQELAGKNQELANKNEELMQSYKRANLIFSALSEALPGTVLDEKYQLDEKIGSGGFGAVFRATHLVTKRQVAVKVFQPMAGNATAEGLERFQLEAILACRVNHSNAIEVLDSGISGGIAYIIMELLNGYPLTQELRTHNYLTPKRCAEIIVPVCDVLAKAHAAGIIHRDIKPDNIFLHHSEQGEVIKVVDFGIAKLQGEIEGVAMNNLTVAGGLVGTPTYMSPERLLQNICEESSDIYSLGIMLYQMLCGKVPFSSSDLWQTIQMHLSETPPPLRTINPEVPIEIENIVMQTLKKEPQERPTAIGLAEGFSVALGMEVKPNTKRHTKILVSETKADQPASADSPTLGIILNN